MKTEEKSIGEVWKNKISERKGIKRKVNIERNIKEWNEKKDKS